MRRKREPKRELSPFERELLDAPCRRHAGGAVCDDCSTPRQRDSTGFPSAMHAAGRLRVRVCGPCGKLFAIGEWSFATRSCNGCADTPGDAIGGATPPVAKPATSPRLRRITRS